MPPLPPAPQVVRIAVSGTNQSHPWANIMHLKYIGASPTDVQLNALCASIGTLWSTTFATLVPSSTVQTQVVAVDLTDASGKTGIDSTQHPGTATAGITLPVNVAMCVTWKTGMRWRGGHPRTYITGLQTADVISGNNWATGTLTNALAKATAFRTGLNGLTAAGNTWSFVVLRRHQTLTDGSHVPLNPPLPVPIAGELVDHRIDSQRRRLGPDVAA